MLSVVVKTLDAQSRLFTIPENTTIKDFKVLIASDVNIPANQQRLIYKGKVLSDELCLTQEHNGNALHLVERPPGVAAPTTPVTTTPSASNRIHTGTLNPTQLSRMLLTQTMSDFGDVLGGHNVGTSSRASNIRSSLDPISIHTYNISLGQLGQQTSGSTSHQSTTTTTPPLVDRERVRTDIIYPRQQLNVLDRILTRLNSTIDELERIPTEPVPPEPSNSSVFISEIEVADGAVDTSTTSEDRQPPVPTTRPNTSETATGTESRPSITSSPTLPVLSTYFRRMLEAQHRLEPFINRAIQFFQLDPPLEDTQSPEFLLTHRLLTLVLQAQHRMSNVHRVLSRIRIALSASSPRVMLTRRHRLPRSSDVDRLLRGRSHGNARVPQTSSTPRSGQRHSGAGGGQHQLLRRFLHTNLLPGRMHFHVVSGPMLSTTRTGPSNTATTTTANTASTGSQGLTSTPTTVTESTTGQPTETATSTSAMQGNTDVLSFLRSFPFGAIARPLSGSTNTVSSASTRFSSNLDSNQQQQSDIAQTPPTSDAGGAQNTPRYAPDFAGAAQDILSATYQSVAQEERRHGQNQTSDMVIVQREDADDYEFANLFEEYVMHNAGSRSSLESQTNSNDDEASSTQVSTPESASFHTASSSNSSASVITTLPNATSSSMQSMDHSPRSKAPKRRRRDNVEANSHVIFLNQIVDILRTPTEDTNSVYSMLLLMITNDLTDQDIVGVIHGEARPLNAIRNRLQEIFSRGYFGGRNPTCVEDIEGVATTVSELVRHFITNLFKDANVKDDYDITESNMSLLRHAFKRTMEILYLSDISTYANDLHKHICFVICVWIKLNESLLIGGRRELISLIKNLEGNAARVTVTHAESLFAHERRAPSPCDACVEHLLTLSDVSLEQKDKFVRYRLPLESNESEIGAAARSDSTCDVDDKLGASKENVTSSESAEVGTSEVPSASEGVTAEASAKQGVPSEWVETLADDVNKQKNMTQQSSYSEAYMAGMPPSKRRKVAS